MTQTEPRRALLGVFAHPDDESFGTGGLLARYVAEGAHVSLVCATNGEVGEISDPSLATPETLGDVRVGEMENAARVLGISELIMLGYRDSGMPGTPDNNDPRAFAQAPDGEVVSRLVGIIRRLRPQVVVTFDPNGGYGHPDHISIHLHTVAAFHAAGDPARYPDEGAPWLPARLFYSAIPRSAFKEMREHMKSAGIDTSDFERFEEAVIGWDDDQINVIMDVSDTIDIKWEALQCHRTQLGGENFFSRMPEAVRRQILSRETFVQAWPEPSEGLRLTHLFDGL
ncbi:MAG: PIG-L family deacetylase [Chloroflexi bacterium]|nr:PIG-L family deacetylase [Chloroflexota bacterium]